MELNGIKIALLGNSGVGKTSIIFRYTTGKFDPDSLITKGANFSESEIEINGQIYYLDIWDTAGQEQYRSLGKYFYKDAYIVILVYDISNKQSFEDLKNIWYSDLIRYGEKCTVIAIVGNKVDLYENEEVTENEGRAFAKEKKALFMQVSAKNDDNITALFKALISKYLDPSFQLLVDEMSQKSEGSVKLKKRSKEEEDKIKKARQNRCC